MSEQFALRKLFLVKKGLSPFLSVFLLVMLIIVILIAAGSGGSFQVKPWVPFLVVALAAWAVYDIVQFRKLLKYRVVLHPDAIEIGGHRVPWNDIESATPGRRGLTGNDIVLKLRSGGLQSIPGDIDGLAYLSQVIESRKV